MVEHLVCNQGVVGSNPVASTNLAPASATQVVSTPAVITQMREELRFRRSSTDLFGDSSPNGTRRSLFFENEVDRERW